MCLYISLESVFFGSGYTYDGFIVLACTTNIINNNIDHCFSYVTTSSNNELNVWHSGLGLIDVERMNRLARNSLLDPLTRVDLDTCEPCFRWKSNKETIWESS